MHAGYFRISVIHRTLTWTSGSLTCVHGLSYACVYTRGVGHTTPTASQHNHFDSEKLTVFLVPLTGLEPSTFGSPIQRSNHWANPVIMIIMFCTMNFGKLLLNFSCAPGEIGTLHLWISIQSNALTTGPTRQPCPTRSQSPIDCWRHPRPVVLKTHLMHLLASCLCFWASERFLLLLLLTKLSAWDRSIGASTTSVCRQLSTG